MKCLGAPNHLDRIFTDCGSSGIGAFPIARPCVEVAGWSAGFAKLELGIDDKSGLTWFKLRNYGGWWDSTKLLNQLDKFDSTGFNEHMRLQP